MVMTLFMALAFVVFGRQSLTASIALAQATPASTPVITECTVQPRTVAGINEIAFSGATPANGTPFPDDPNELVPYVKPLGPPASAQTVEEVTATIEQFVACVNAGDPLRYFAVLSDDFIRELAAGNPIIDEDDPELTPSPVAEDERVVIGEIIDVIELPDGRVNALITSLGADDSGDPIQIQILFVYDQDRERWMIDVFQEVVFQEGTIPWMLVQGEGYEGVIVPPVEAAELTDFFVDGDVQELWHPTEEDVAALERNLPSYLETIAAVTPGVREGVIDRLPDYKRQYAGFVQDGRRLILVNALCSGDDLNWRTQPVFVSDGGDCFFRVTYEPATRQFSAFEVNGEA